MMIKVYRGTDGDVEPIEMECEVFGHPHKTTTGESMFGNTHFKTKEEAWESILASCEAQLSLTTRALMDTEQRLVRQKDEVVEASKRTVKAMKRHKGYLRMKG